MERVLFVCAISVSPLVYATERASWFVLLCVRGRPCSVPHVFFLCIRGVKAAPPLMIATTFTARPTEPGLPSPGKAHVRKECRRLMPVALMATLLFPTTSPLVRHNPSREAHGGGKRLPIDCTAHPQFINPQKMFLDVHRPTNGMLMVVDLYRSRFIITFCSAADGTECT